MPPPNPPSPEDLEKLKTFGDFLADVFVENWKKRGTFLGFADLVVQRQQAKATTGVTHAPGTPQPPRPSAYGAVHRVTIVDEDGYKREVETTVPQLLADILSSHHELIRRMEEINEEDRPRRKRSRKRGG